MGDLEWVQEEVDLRQWVWDLLDRLEVSTDKSWGVIRVVDLMREYRPRNRIDRAGVALTWGRFFPGFPPPQRGDGGPGGPRGRHAHGPPGDPDDIVRSHRPLLT